MTEVTNIKAPRDLIKGLEDMIALAKKGKIRGSITYYETTYDNDPYTYAFYGFNNPEVMGVCARMAHIANMDWDKLQAGPDSHA